jgi:hypothetical protein
MSRITPTFEVTLEIGLFPAVQWWKEKEGLVYVLEAYYDRIPAPEPEQHGEPTDICVYTGLTGWAVRRRMTVCPFGLGAFNPFNVERPL